MQKGFSRYDQTKKLADDIENMLRKKPFDVVIATKFMNYDNSIYEKMFNWHRLKTENDRKLTGELEKFSDIVFDKSIYTCVNTHFLQRLCQLNNGDYPKKIFVAGADTDCCILKIATDLFENNIRPIVLTKYCNSNGGEESHKAGILCMKRLIGDKQLTDVEINSSDDLINL